MTTEREAIADVVRAGAALVRAKGSGTAARRKLAQAALDLYEATKIAQRDADLRGPCCDLVCFDEKGELRKMRVVVLRKTKTGAIVIRHVGCYSCQTFVFVRVRDCCGDSFVQKDTVTSLRRYRRWLSNVPPEYQAESTN